MALKQGATTALHIGVGDFGARMRTSEPALCRMWPGDASCSEAQSCALEPPPSGWIRLSPAAGQCITQHPGVLLT